MQQTVNLGGGALSISPLRINKDIEKFRNPRRLQFFTFIVITWLLVSCRWVACFANCPWSVLSLGWTDSCHVSVPLPPALPSQGPRSARAVVPVHPHYP